MHLCSAPFCSYDLAAPLVAVLRMTTQTLLLRA